jgi:hypothetical protein
LKGLADRLKYYTRAKEVLGVLVSRGLMAPESERDIPILPEFTRGREVLDAEPPVKKTRKAARKKANTRP